MNSMLLSLFLAACLFFACDSSVTHTEEYKESAQTYIQSLYAGDTSRLDVLASENIRISYPVFQEILGKGVIVGKKAAKEFSIGFANRWHDQSISFDEIIAEENSVVLVWSFEAKRMPTFIDSTGLPGKTSRWGGITFLHFDANGKIEIETGEESTPGPMARLREQEVEI